MQAESAGPIQTETHPQKQPLGLTLAQFRVWLDCRLSNSSRWANCGHTLVLRGPFDVELFERAVSHTVSHTAALRLQVYEHGGLPVQIIRPAVDVHISRVDLRNRADDAAIRAYVEQEHSRPLDLAKCAFRFTVLELAPEHFLICGVFHHCCIDGYGINLLWTGIAATYTALSRGEAVPGTSDLAQYDEYVRTELARADQSIFGRSGENGARQPPAEEVTLSRVAARELPRAGPVRGRALLSQDLMATLRATADATGIRVSRLLTAALVLYVSRFTGRSSFPLLLLVHGRHHRWTRDLIAMCTTTEAIQFTLPPTASVGELIAAVSQQIDEELLSTRRRNDMGVDSPRGGKGRGVGISINVMTFPAPPMMGDVVVECGPYEALGPINDLEIFLDLRHPTRPCLELWANARQYEQAEIDAHGVRLIHWLRNLAASTAKPLAVIALCDDGERARVLEQWNDTSHMMTLPTGLHELFDVQARRTPNAIACVSEDGSLSYAELHRRAGEVARCLVAQGVRAESVVGLCVQRSNEMLVGALGILEAGGAYLPLEPKTPRERLQFMLEDSCVRVVLTQARWAPELRALGVEVLCLDEPLPSIGMMQAEAVRTVDPSQPAYVIYTSGSTGKPKGVINVHSAVVNRVAWMQHRYALGATDRVLQKTPFTFDVSVWELFWPIANGGQLVFARPEGHRDPQYLAAAIERFGITLIHFVPTMLAEFVSHVAAGRCTTIRDTFCSGEELPGGLAQTFLKRFSSRLHNLYGPTEAAIDVSFHECSGHDDGPSVSIGRPISNVRLYVLDDRMAPCPVGKPGELYIGGQGLARGYIARAGLTAARFVADPYGSEGARLYRTGDQARLLPDGRIEFMGRLDHQVKIRGLRIEPGEIEVVLRSHPAVADAVVCPRRDACGEQTLIAYVVPRDESLGFAHLRAFLRDRLPEYMVPAACVQMSAFPLTSSGKLDRRALPEPEEGAYRAQPYEPPQGALEQQIAEILAQVLSKDRVGRHDSFFEMGGTSLSAVRAIDSMRCRGLAVDLPSLFEWKTPAQLARSLGEGGDAPAVTDNVELALATPSPEQLERIAGRMASASARIVDAYALTPMQAGILFHHFLTREGDPYVHHCWLSFESREAIERFVTAMNHLVRRHAVLRSAIVWEGAHPLQAVLSDAPWQTEEFPLAGEDAEQALARAFDPHHYRLDVRQAPLMKGYFAQDIRRERWVFVWLIHHLIADGLSVQVLLEELDQVLAGRGESLPAPWPFRRHVALLQASAHEPQRDAFFREMLGTFTSPTSVPGMAMIRPGENPAVAEASLALDGRTARAVRESAQRANVSVACICHLAYATLLAQLCEQRDIVFGTVLFGRAQSEEGARRAVGLFINTLPIRIRLEGRAIGDVAKNTQALLTGLLSHERASLESVQRCSGLPPATPLISALLNYTQSQKVARQWPQFRLLRVDGHTNYPLAVTVDDDGQDLRIGAQSLVSVAPEALCQKMSDALWDIAIELARS